LGGGADAKGSTVANGSAGGNGAGTVGALDWNEPDRSWALWKDDGGRDLYHKILSQFSFLYV